MAATGLFTQAVEKEIAEILTRYPQPRAAILPILHIAQREQGFVSAEAEEYIARLLDLPPVKVHEVVTFYSMLHLEPVGRHNLQFCRTLSCALRGGEKLMAETRRKLKIRDHEVTADGRYSVEGVECLGACGNAPVVQVNEDYHYDLTQEKLDKLLEGLS